MIIKRKYDTFEDIKSPLKIPSTTNEYLPKALRTKKIVTKKIEEKKQIPIDYTNLYIILTMILLITLSQFIEIKI